MAKTLKQRALEEHQRRWKEEPENLVKKMFASMAIDTLHEKDVWYPIERATPNLKKGDELLLCLEDKQVVIGYYGQIYGDDSEYSWVSQAMYYENPPDCLQRLNPTHFKIVDLSPPQ